MFNGNAKDNLGWAFFWVKLEEAVKEGKYEVKFLFDAVNVVYWTGPQRIKIVAFTGNMEVSDVYGCLWEHIILELDNIAPHVIMELLYRQIDDGIYNPACEKLLKLYEEEKQKLLSK